VVLVAQLQLVVRLQLLVVLVDQHQVLVAC
jgi:hypothetical protein